jgi:uncharacterized protein YcbK (DUF882 family)
MLNECTRRRFLSIGIQLFAGLAFSAPLNSFAAALSRSPLLFSHTHTGERFEIVPVVSKLGTKDLEHFNYFLRDFRTDDVYPIDPGLLNILQGIRLITGSRGVVEVISGYRSPQTNKLLRKKSFGVAPKSLHLSGKAIDVRFTDIRTSRIRDVAISLQQGGIGYYRKSNFVHLDTGRFRTW